MSHDPRQVVDDLRSHLATHEKRIVFLFGAGTSCAVRSEHDSTPLIPAVAGLTTLCGQAVSKLGASYLSAWTGLSAECVGAGSPANVETLLSRLRMKLDAMVETDQMLGLDRKHLGQIESTITATIAKAVQPCEAAIPARLPHHDFARWIARTPRRFPIEVFTTNYDLLIERALEDERIPVFDGFVGVRNAFFLPDSLGRPETSPGSTWTRVWKIHGSVNWRWEDIDGARRIVRGQPLATGELILPSHHKYEESRKQPYLSLLDRLRQVLGYDDSVLICVGYSFGDDHINSIIFDALASRPRVHTYALQFQAVEHTGRLVDAAQRLSNLLVLDPNTAVIGSQVGEWRLTEPMSDGVSDFMKSAFQQAPAVEGEPDYLTGIFRLGDFIPFCELLSNLSARP